MGMRLNKNDWGIPLSGPSMCPGFIFSSMFGVAMQLPSLLSQFVFFECQVGVAEVVSDWRSAGCVLANYSTFFCLLN